MITTAPNYPWHGTHGDASWSPPACVCESTRLARPKYNSVATASEYLDAPEVLLAKVRLLAQMIQASRTFCVYTGAGISTAAGIPDYASKAAGSIVAGPKEGSSVNRLAMKPTTAHRILTALEKRGHLQFWLQQNHDGLAQKAGFPYAKLNEIHGSWFDTQHNPVVTMDGTLRPDLLEWMVDWSQKADLTLAIGTSMCGMTSDCMAQRTSERHLRHGQGLGLVILNLQKTPYDDRASLRIFAKADDCLQLLTKVMKLGPLDMSMHSPHPPPMMLAKLHKERQKAKAAAASPPTMTHQL